MALLDRSRTALQLSNRLEHLTVDQRTNWTQSLRTTSLIMTQAVQALDDAIIMGAHDHRIQAHKVRQAYDATSKVRLRLRDLWET